MQNKTFISTFNKRLYKEYAYRLISTYSKTDQSIPMVIYVEDDIEYYPKHTQIKWVSLFKEEPELNNFINRNHNRPVKDFFRDAVRFSYKVFAQRAATRLDEKKIFYIDSDCVFAKKIPEDWFDKVLPTDTFVSFYQRPNYTETGFLAFDNSKPYTKQFFDKYIDWYINDTVYELSAFTDCHTFDATREYMKKKEPSYVEKTLGDGQAGHIMARDKLINQYIDHRKGKRKEQENSPEWIKQRS